MKLPFFLSTILYVFNLQAQIPENYFSPPLKIPLILSGTFGELRSNHFHSGIDIKTQGVEGKNIYAAAEGYVSRIKISNYGYGKALYIQHPNGYTTVYAHLKKFAPKIEALVKAEQYANESYTVELFPDKNKLPVSKEEIIALSGNSGGSGGPHLHFEIRDGQQRPMNPFLFGIEVKDTRQPLVNHTWLYPLDEKATVNGSQKPYRLKLKNLGNGMLEAYPVKAHGLIGIAVNSTDQQDAANNKNGYYKITSTVNGNKSFELEMNKFAFSETRYVNRMIDYKYFKENRSRITKLFKETNNPLSIIKAGDGYLNIQDSLSYNCLVTISDYKKNLKEITIPITGEANALPAQNVSQAYEHYAYSHVPFQFSNSYVSVNIPKGALYEDIPLEIKELPNNCIQIHNHNTPLHKNMNIAFSLDNITNKKQCYIGNVRADGNAGGYVGANKTGNYVSAKTKTFGNFGVFYDENKPLIRPINFSNNKWISSNKTLRLWIQDKETEIKNFKATINGKFALMEYDYKRNLIVHDLSDGIYTSGRNDLKVYVEDNVGNNTIFECTFYRK